MWKFLRVDITDINPSVARETFSETEKRLSRGKINLSQITAFRNHETRGTLS